MDSDSDMDLDSSEQVDEEMGLVVGSNYVAPPAPAPALEDLVGDACAEGDAEALRQLLEQGASPDDRQPVTLNSPLHILCTHASPPKGDRIACFELLRAAGANLDARDRTGYTPLHHAAELSPSLTSALIEAGASLNVKGGGDYTPLHYAAGYGSYVGELTVPLLLRAGAAVNAKDWDGATPLQLAIDSIPGQSWRRHHHRVIPMLLCAGAEIPFTAPDGMANPTENPYIRRVLMAGGFKKYEQAHIARITKILAPTPRLPPEMVRNIVEFWLHAGYY